MSTAQDRQRWQVILSVAPEGGVRTSMEEMLAEIRRLDAEVARLAEPAPTEEHNLTADGAALLAVEPSAITWADTVGRVNGWSIEAWASADGWHMSVQCEERVPGRTLGDAKAAAEQRLRQFAAALLAGQPATVQAQPACGVCGKPAGATMLGDGAGRWWHPACAPEPAPPPADDERVALYSGLYETERQRALVAEGELEKARVQIAKLTAALAAGVQAVEQATATLRALGDARAALDALKGLGRG